MNDSREHALRLLELLLSSEKKKSQRQRDTALLCRLEPLEAYQDIPEEEFCTGWAYRLGRHFSNALDLSLDRRIRNKKPYYVWTQGTAFHFREGYTVHQTDGGGVIQVQSGKAAVPAKGGERRDPGYARVQFYLPKDVPGTWAKARLLDMTQDQLVRMLITGDAPSCGGV